jgi:hypothetical protein
MSINVQRECGKVLRETSDYAGNVVWCVTGRTLVQLPVPGIDLGIVIKPTKTEPLTASGTQKSSRSSATRSSQGRCAMTGKGKGRATILPARPLARPVAARGVSGQSIVRAGRHVLP